MSYWHNPMNVETARRVLGSAHFDYAVEQGAGFCESRANGAWMANTPESYAAYICAANVAKGA